MSASAAAAACAAFAAADAAADALRCAASAAAMAGAATCAAAATTALCLSVSRLRLRSALCSISTLLRWCASAKVSWRLRRFGSAPIRFSFVGLVAVWVPYLCAFSASSRRFWLAAAFSIFSRSRRAASSSRDSHTSGSRAGALFSSSSSNGFRCRGLVSDSLNGRGISLPSLSLGNFFPSSSAEALGGSLSVRPPNATGALRRLASSAACARLASASASAASTSAFRWSSSAARVLAARSIRSSLRFARALAAARRVADAFRTVSVIPSAPSAPSSALSPSEKCPDIDG
mmetsp:Transcript_12128/g.56296  ORF Transcript_12128/g.56296 Transcript_12128/m.56296 type:complete len:290 (+) Transcript_12128:1597-2466(+)